MRENISIIVAIGENNEIGKDNKLLWHLPEDMKWFKKITTGGTVIMGKNTFLSLPKGALPNRTNIVITDNEHDQYQGCEMAYSIEDALNKAATEVECFIIGGASIYRQFFPYAHKLYLTMVHASFDADTFFPDIKISDWQEIERIPMHADEKNPYPFSFVTLVRKS